MAAPIPALDNNCHLIYGSTILLILARVAILYGSISHVGFMYMQTTWSSALPTWQAQAAAHAVHSAAAITSMSVMYLYLTVMTHMHRWQSDLHATATAACLASHFLGGCLQDPDDVPGRGPVLRLRLAALFDEYRHFVGALLWTPEVADSRLCQSQSRSEVMRAFASTRSQLVSRLQ